MQLTAPLYWYRGNNFGDELAPIICRHFSGRDPVYVDLTSDIPHLCIIGSVLQDMGPNTVVWGAGYVEKPQGQQVREVLALRGEFSRDIYNLYHGTEIEVPLGDPAMLMPFIFQPPHVKKYRLGIIPHVIDLMDCALKYGGAEDCLVINLRDDPGIVIQHILSCEQVISSALHGLIVAHAYGIPAAWVEFSDRILGNGFKFWDYFTTIDEWNDPIDMRKFPDIRPFKSMRMPQPKPTVDLDALAKSFPTFT